MERPERLANPLNIFNEPAQVAGSAATMSVVMTDPNQIAAASAGNGTGDNSNAVAMADLASADDCERTDTDQFLLELCVDAGLDGGRKYKRRTRRRMRR